MKTTIIAFIVLCFCSGCVKLYEEVDLEIMKRPVIETDSIKPPDWDIHFPSH